jgi:hypothetical protein
MHKQITLWLDEGLAEKLELVRKARGLMRATVVKRLIEEAWEKEQEKLWPADLKERGGA